MSPQVFRCMVADMAKSVTMVRFNSNLERVRSCLRKESYAEAESKTTSFSSCLLKVFALGLQRIYAQTRTLRRRIT